ncbi:MAG: alpha/beta fold hydrolase [Crocinitomicaceae bacterium]
MKDLILLHGALGASKEFDALIPFLENDFKVYRFDFIGHGQNTDTTLFSMENFARQLKQFIEDRQLEKPQIFGYSMGGYVAYTLAIKSPDLIGDIMSLGTKLKWDPLTAKAETAKLNPNKITEKVPKFGQYLDSIHLSWHENMRKTVELMNNLGNGDALSFEDFGKIKNKCFIGIGDMDEMVSCSETIDISKALPNSIYYKLLNSRHPLPQIEMKKLAGKIKNYLK